MMEYFVASGKHPPYRTCMKKVAEADLLVVIVPTATAGSRPTSLKHTLPLGGKLDKANRDEAPVHEVNVESYQIAAYPVTVAEYRRFVESEGYLDRRWWTGGGFGKTSGPEKWADQSAHPNRPVTSVNWYEASAYCAWAKVRLPGETEWERAARGRSARKYPWGDAQPDATRANFNAGKVGHATPVGLYPYGATPEGVHDMAGNVYEWVADVYAPHGEPAEEETAGSAPERVLRGGCWYSNARVLRAAYRDLKEADNRKPDIGFRCVRDMAPNSATIQS